MYQKEVNSSKNNSELTHTRYLVNYLFKLDKSTSCLPPVEKSMMCDNQYWRSDYFCEPSKNAVVPSQWKSKQFEINLRVWHHAVRSQWVCMRSEVNSETCVTFNCILTSNPISQPLTSCIFIVTSEGHTCPGINLWHYTHQSWPLRMVSHPKLISRLFYFSLIWRKCIFAWLTKSATGSFLIVTHQWFFNWWKTRCWFI